MSVRDFLSEAGNDPLGRSNDSRQMPSMIFGIADGIEARDQAETLSPQGSAR
ncbi:hypothetical protein [Trinickia symbiotica]|uniref:hypothetical protein n=1 Tax=Trinickia symbiotica TaxID=863227 RepID=UPI001675FE3E|nr:hypothetical protein [Trinickia symbiotica]